MINLQIRQLRNSLIAILNTNTLPIEVKRLVLAEVYTAFSEQSDKIILTEKNKSKEKMKKTEENKNE